MHKKRERIHTKAHLYTIYPFFFKTKELSMAKPLRCWLNLKVLTAPQQPASGKFRVSSIAWFEHNLSFQNFTSSHIEKKALVLNISQSFLMVFHSPTPYQSLASQELHPPSSSLYFPPMTCFQRASHFKCTMPTLEPYLPRGNPFEFPKLFWHCYG